MKNIEAVLYDNDNKIKIQKNSQGVQKAAEKGIEEIPKEGLREI